MFKRNEALLLLVIALVAAGIYGVARWTAAPFFGASDVGARVQVLVDGAEVLSLPAEAIGEHELPLNGGERNRIEITAQGVRMVQANCPDHWCMRKGTVPPGAGAIVCLPHRLIVRWERPAQEAPDEVDMVVQ